MLAEESFVTLCFHIMLSPGIYLLWRNRRGECRLRIVVLPPSSCYFFFLCCNGCVLEQCCMSTKALHDCSSPMGRHNHNNGKETRVVMRVKRKLFFSLPFLSFTKDSGALSTEVVAAAAVVLQSRVAGASSRYNCCCKQTLRAIDCCWPQQKRGQPMLQAEITKAATLYYSQAHCKAPIICRQLLSLLSYCKRHDDISFFLSQT